MALFGSSSPFGASTSSPFGGASPSTNPFGASNPSNPFGVTQNTNLFGAKPFGSPTFGGQTGSSLFGGTATGVFGATQASPLGSSVPAFGSSSTPAFGSSSSPFGSGSTLFGQKPPTPFGGFGSTPGQSNPFGSTPFGQSQPAFGSQPFGSTAPAFGSTTPAFGSTLSLNFGSSTPAFGASSTPAFGVSSTPAFGASSTPAFGASSTPAFGASSTPAFGASSTPAFGSSSPSLFGSTTPVFGQSAPTFGSSSTPAFGSTPLFGSGSPASPFGAQSTPAFGAASSPSFGSTTFGATPYGGQRVGSRLFPYTVTSDADAGVSGQVGKLMSICAMPNYKNKSPEELRWEDYQAGDKGGAAAGQPTATGIFGQTPSSSPFNTGTSTAFGQPQTSNPFATSSNIFGAKPAGSFGSSSSSSFGTFGTPPTGSAFSSGAASIFGGSPFATSSTPGFGSTTSTFGTPAPGFSSGSGFSTPGLFNSASSSFGTSNLFGQSQPAAGLFATPNQSFGASTSAFGGSSTANFGANLFAGTPSPFQTKPAGLTPSLPSFSSFQPSLTGQPGSTFGFGGLGQSQPGASSPFGAASTPGIGQNTFPQQSVAPVPVSNPFGVLPAMPQMSIGRSAGTGPSVQYGIASIPVSDRPTQVRTNSLLTPRHITQRSRIRMQARRYHPKKDAPKISFFSDSEETTDTPKAEAMFIPRENPRALLIRQPDRSPSIPTSTSLNAREIATPVKQHGVVTEQDGMADLSSSPRQGPESPLQSWSSPILGGASTQSNSSPSKVGEGIPSSKSLSKQNGSPAEHNHRGNGYFSITGHRAGEAAVAYEHGADIEALMPKLRHSDYYIQPRVQELAAKERAESGYCRRVNDFVVGRHGYGFVKFLGETDVRGLDLEAIIQFNKCEVLVYMDESKKPPPGTGLNKPAEITLLNVKYLDKKTGQHLSEGAEVEKFEKKLKRKTEEQGAEFISYVAAKGEWKFRVKHFSKYSLSKLDCQENLGVESDDTLLTELELQKKMSELKAREQEALNVKFSDDEGKTAYNSILEGDQDVNRAVLAEQMR